MEKGFIHIYTGNGKGKSTAALGLAIRAAISGYKVFFATFYKDSNYSEFSLGNYFDNIRIKELLNKNKESDKDNILKFLENLVTSDDYDVIVLDEIFIPILLNVFNSNDIINLMKIKNNKVELVLTGIKAPLEIINEADLVTEMKEIRHYYKNGVLSRKGIDKWNRKYKRNFLKGYYLGDDLNSGSQKNPY